MSVLAVRIVYYLQIVVELNQGQPETNPSQRLERDLNLSVLAVRIRGISRQ